MRSLRVPIASVAVVAGAALASCYGMFESRDAGSCSADSPCPVGERGSHCVDGACVPGCSGDEHCPEGLRCASGLCREPGPEECNGYDDDLDGEADEGFDVDYDGFSSCRFVDDPFDCDDQHPEVRPGGAEACDDLDNNCDGRVDEDNGGCEAPELCVSERRRCINPTCATDLDCDSGQFCDMESGQCYSDAVSFGESCVRDEQCPSGACLRTNALGVEGRRCTSLCCRQEDCPPGSFCADNGTGLKVCAPADWFGSVGMACGEEECAACDLHDQCRPLCCSDTDCEADCVRDAVRTPAAPAEDFPTTTCGLRFGGVGVYLESNCGRVGSVLLTWCRSGLEWDLESMLGIPTRCLCSMPCCNDEDCRDGDHPGALCVVSEPVVPACYDPGNVDLVATHPLGSLAVGDRTCTAWSDCATGACHPDGYCTRTCCPGDACPVGYDCRPVELAGGRVANLCSALTGN